VGGPGGKVFLIVQKVATSIMKNNRANKNESGQNSVKNFRAVLCAPISVRGMRKEEAFPKRKTSSVCGVARSFGKERCLWVGKG